MKKSIFLFFLFLLSLPLWAMDATMYKWQSHFAYGSLSQIVDAGTKIYGLTNGSLYSVDKNTEEVIAYSKQNGLNGGEIVSLGYDELTLTLVIAYSDGLIDLMQGGQFIAMTDLQQKSMSASKRANKILVENGIAYFCMPFGIMTVDVKKHVVKDTYYIGEKGADVDVLDLAFAPDSIYAVSATTLFSAAHNTNWMDYANWHRANPLSVQYAYQAVAYWEGQLFVLVDMNLKRRNGQAWSSPCPDMYITGINPSKDKLFLITSVSNGIYYLDKDFIAQPPIASAYTPLSIVANGSTYWLATEEDGIVKQTSSQTQSFVVNGPLVNIPYRLKVVNDKLYMLEGQRWASETGHDADIMIYDLQQEFWTNISHEQVDKQAGSHITDLMNVAVDPSDPSHFYVTSYGKGMLECKGTDVIRQYTEGNSPFHSTIPGDLGYIRTDGATFDAQGNLWVVNAGDGKIIHVATPAQLAASQQTGIGQWYSMSLWSNLGGNIHIETPGELFIDNRYPNWKWIPTCRSTQQFGSAGLILLDDNNTPQYSGDDVVVSRTSFVDQDGNTVVPSALRSVVQDKEGAIWIGMSNGIITIPADVDARKSNRCERIKIARNDGTGLADYLLETESVKAMAVDGANRKWIGTEASGVYLLSADGLETIHHFTTDNSPLIDNSILSIAIHPASGRVYIGTNSGLMSYQSDAATPFEDYSSVYAYPNPVRPEYAGVITIRGLMDETIVHIVDVAGNLVCETRSNGGLAIWDGRTADGRRAASGVYTVFLNENGDNKHALTKILLMH